MKIKKLLPTIQENIILAKKTTFKIGGPARYFLVSNSEEDLIKAIKAAKQLNLPFFVLGGGSNVLFPDKGYRGLIINFQFSSVSSGVRKNGIITGAGTKLEKLINVSVEKSLTGLEWATGIPGTVGGAVYGNSGAFGQSMGKIVYKVRVLNSKNLKVKNILRKDCKFSNKNSVFKQKDNLIILSAVLKLKKGDKIKIREKMKEFLGYRKKNHPSASFSAGCAFQNYKGEISNKKLLKYFPELKKFNRQKLIPASYLIDRCGLKGKKSGKAEISKKHANFILNLGGAKAKDVIKLIDIAGQKVENKFGIRLEKEIKVIHP